jgi:hypothetical protein
MTKPVERFTYTFGELVLVARRPEGRQSVTWYMNCPECSGQHMFRKTGSKVWHTSCWKSGVEWTITPAEYYVQRPLDLSRVLGEA